MTPIWKYARKSARCWNFAGTETFPVRLAVPAAKSGAFLHMNTIGDE
jgi:hypothetical protein